ncbi:hypothetical protein Tco_0357451 [Tanacetum coccineum]
MAFEEYSQEVLGFTDISQWNSTTEAILNSEPTTSPSNQELISQKSELDLKCALTIEVKMKPHPQRPLPSTISLTKSMMIIAGMNTTVPRLFIPSPEDDGRTLWTHSRSLGILPKPAFSRFRPHAFKSVKHQLSLNWEKSHLNGQQSALSLGHKISKKGIELTNAKIDVIAKLPHPTTVKGIRAFYGHVARFFIGGFIQDFSKISRTMTHLLEKNTPFIFSDDCIRAFQTLKDRLTEAPI